MKNIFSKSLAGVSIIIIAFTCTKTVVKNNSGGNIDSRTANEARFDPMAFEGDNNIITSDVPRANDSLKINDEIKMPEFLSNSNSAEQVFSVQIFSSKSNLEAAEFFENAKTMLTDSVRVDYQPPYYKIRVGRCVGLDEGQVYLEKIKNMGFPKAWLVRAR